MTETLVREQTITAEEFWHYCANHDGRPELVNGKIVEMPPVGPEHGKIDSRLDRVLGTFVEDRGLGETYLNTGFILRRDPDLVRGPDEAFIATERIAANPPPPKGFWPIAPDLVVEFVSPDDTATDVNAKVTDYLETGVRLVWVFYPIGRQVHVYRPGFSVEILQRDGILSGEDVVPGFTLGLARFWR